MRMNLIRPFAVAGLALVIGACGSDDNNSNPTVPEPVATPTPAPTPSPTPAPASAYAGRWSFTSWITAPGNDACGHTDADVGVRKSVDVEVANDGTFAVPGPINGAGAIDRDGNVQLTLDARGNGCPGGSGAGGCLHTSHCDGTAVQGNDVTKWTLKR